MIRITPLFVGILSASSIAISAPAQARLVSGGLVVYDLDRNLTWVANANINGPMNWWEANAWANALVYAGYDDWHLPAADISCNGFNCANDALGHLFYSELGGVNFSPIGVKHNSNLSLFSNVQSASYWTSTQYAQNAAWQFNFGNGFANPTLTHISETTFKLLYAWPVREGIPAAIPEPKMSTMLLAGLGLIGFVVRRRFLSRCKRLE